MKVDVIKTSFCKYLLQTFKDEPIITSTGAAILDNPTSITFFLVLLSLLKFKGVILAETWSYQYSLSLPFYKLFI